MMQARALLEELDALDVTVTAVGEKLQLRPGSRVPPELVDALRQHKAEILALLRQELAQDPLVPWMLQEWRRVSIPQWRDILRESIAQGDMGRADYARWMLRDFLFAPEYEDGG